VQFFLNQCQIASSTQVHAWPEMFIVGLENDSGGDFLQNLEQPTLSVANLQ
jgi:hypothetical protein